MTRPWSGCAALPVAFDEALPEALTTMDTMLTAVFLGLQLEGDRSKRAYPTTEA